MEVEVVRTRVTLECTECKNKYSQKILFNSLNEYLSFLDKYEN